MMSFTFVIGYSFWGANRNDVELQGCGPASFSDLTDVPTTLSTTFLIQVKIQTLDTNSTPPLNTSMGIARMQHSRCVIDWDTVVLYLATQQSFWNNTPYGISCVNVSKCFSFAKFFCVPLWMNVPLKCYAIDRLNDKCMFMSDTWCTISPLVLVWYNTDRQ